MLTENENFIALIKRLQELDYVIQVRFHHVLKETFVDQVGKDGMNVTCIIRSTMKDDAFIRFVTLVPNEVYNNLDKHDFIVSSVKQRIDDYILHNVPPVKY
jgi:hypothetical protein